jgi:cell division protein FtsL
MRYYIIVVGCLSVLFIFGKIFQQHVYHDLLYRLQRLDQSYQILVARYASLIVQRTTLTDPQRIRTIAREKFGLEQLTLDRVVTLTAWYAQSASSSGIALS